MKEKQNSLLVFALFAVSPCRCMFLDMPGSLARWTQQIGRGAALRRLGANPSLIIKDFHWPVTGRRRHNNQSEFFSPAMFVFNIFS